MPAVLEPSAIRVCRILRGLSQAELAQLAGVRRETVSRVENGGSPHLRVARGLADAFGLDPDVLFPKEHR